MQQVKLRQERVESQGSDKGLGTKCRSSQDRRLLAYLQKSLPDDLSSAVGGRYPTLVFFVSFLKTSKCVRHAGPVIGKFEGVVPLAGFWGVP